MSKQVFWPLVAVIMGCIFLAANLGLLPQEFLNLWPLILIVVGLGGLLTSDRVEWLVPEKSNKKTKLPAKKRRSR
jgi:hypothetical protein